MSDIRQLRLARWERIQKGGMLRFVLSRGISFSVLFGSMIYFTSPPLIPWHLFVLVFIAAGFVFATVMWFVTMRQYAQALKQTKDQ